MIDPIILARSICDGYEISRKEALDLAHLEGADRMDLFAGANRITRHFHGEAVAFCSIVNAKSGACREDCAYCAQSIHHQAETDVYPLLSDDKFAEYAERADAEAVSRFSVVTSGAALNTDEFDQLLRFIRHQKRTHPHLGCCVSVGFLSWTQAQDLKKAGCERVHHNLETSHNRFSQICTTHSYEDKLKTIRNAKTAGLAVCSGGIFGMGEEWNDRVDLLDALRLLNVDSVPLNFLNPIPGTPAHEKGWGRLAPMEALAVIAVARYLLPRKELRLCGGKERALKDLYPFAFLAGANASMVGGYLTTGGHSVEEERIVIEQLNLKAVREVSS